MDEKEISVRSSLRQRANKARKFRCRSFVCVLENPNNLLNIGSVIRNIDALGVTMLYVVSSKFSAEDLVRTSRNERISRAHKSIQTASLSANQWVYVHHFTTTEQCCDHLAKNYFKSLVTSPHIQGLQNMSLLQTDFTCFKKIAIWFGCETQGISQQAVQSAVGCVQIDMCGIVESLNLAVATGIILHFVASQRRKFAKARRLQKKTPN